MAHFARLDDSNIVVEVNVIADADCLDENGDESEAVGIAFCKSLWGSDTTWIQTSFNDRIRGQFGNLGYKYDATHDIFYCPDKPIDDDGDVCNSYTLNTSTGVWECPLSDPDQWTPSNKTGKNYRWDESLYQSDNTKGWVEMTPHPDFASWVFDSDIGTLKSPIPYPDDGKTYNWSESTYQGDNTKGWVEA
tara:strand:+ start:998 stop:1570 length:573 start_codon:yes stop_codon:yes gene_type:complete